MPTGDSLTTGWAPHLPPMVATFGGTLTGRQGAPPAMHEGRVGWPSWLLLGDLSPALAANRPDVVVIAWGTNDAIAHADPARTLANVNAAIETSQRAGVRGIVLVPPPPILRDASFTGPWVASVTEKMIEIARSRAAAGQNVDVAIVTEQPDASPTGGQGVHYAPAGYQRIAGVIASALQRVASRITPGGASGSSAASALALIAVGIGLVYLLKGGRW